MPGYQYKKDEQVFVLDAPAAAAAKPPSKAPSAAAGAPATPIIPRWLPAKVITASDSVIKVSAQKNEEGETKDLELKANEFDSRLFPKSACQEFFQAKPPLDLAALPKTIKTKLLLDCFLKSPLVLPSSKHYQLACGTGGLIFREHASQYEKEDLIKKQFSQQHQSSKATILFNTHIDCFSTLISEKYGSKVSDTFSNIKRLMVWFFGEENFSKKTSFIVHGSNSNAHLYCIPQFTLTTKATVLPNGESPSSSIDMAARELLSGGEASNVASNAVLTMLNYLLGVQKLWRLTPAASGFKGTEPDLVEAVGYLFPNTNGNEEETGKAVKLLADFLSTEKANSKAPAAQFDEKRIVISDCIIQDAFCNLFLPNQHEHMMKFLEEDGDDNDSSMVWHLSCSESFIPSVAQANAETLEIKTTPVIQATLEFLKANFEKKDVSDIPFPKLLNKLAGMMSSCSALDAESVSGSKLYADTSKSLISALTSDFPPLAACGKDGLLFSSTYLSTEKFKFSPFGWAARLFCYRAMFNDEKESSGSKSLEEKSKLIETLFKKFWPKYSRRISFVFDAGGVAVAGSDELISFLIPTVEYFREQPVDLLSSEKIEALQCVVQKECPGKSSLTKISNCLLQKMVSSFSPSSPTSLFGSFNSDTLELQLSVLGKLALDQLQNEFGSKTLSHIVRALLYRKSAKIVLKKSCKRTVAIVAQTGILGRLSSQFVAEFSIKRKISNYHNSLQEKRQEFFEQESEGREEVEFQQGKSLASIMKVSGAFLYPIIRRRKIRCLQDEQELRMELTMQETKLRRALYDRFFDEEPEEAIPIPAAALESMRKRYEIVKPLMDEEEEARKKIIEDQRERVLKKMAIFENQREVIAKTFLPVPKPQVDWSQLEKAADRRRADEERAFNFLYGDQSQINTSHKQQDRHVIRSPSAYHEYQKMQEQLLVKKRQEELLLEKQRQAREALILNRYNSSNGAPQTKFVDPYEYQKQQQQSQQQRSYSNVNNNNNNISATTSNSTTTTSSAAAGAPLRVSFSAYWSNQYKK